MGLESSVSAGGVIKKVKVSYLVFSYRGVVGRAGYVLAQRFAWHLFSKRKRDLD